MSISDGQVLTEANLSEKLPAVFHNNNRNI